MGLRATSNSGPSKMARVAVAIAFALLVQGAFSAPSGCCPCDCGSSHSNVVFTSGPAPAPVHHDNSCNSAPVHYNTHHATPAETVSQTPLTPVGSPVVVSTSAGTPKITTTGPFCQTSTFEVPVKSTTKAVAGPVSQSCTIHEGYCSTACAATRAKCGGTTKNVSFKTPTIINKGSRTTSTITAAGNAVTTRSTKAGKPVVTTSSRPTCSYGPVAVPAPAPHHIPAPAPHHIPAPTPSCGCHYEAPVHTPSCGCTC